jgi:hypothetical protein
MLILKVGSRSRKYCKSGGESEVELGSESGTCEEGREMRNGSESTVEVCRK